MPKSKPKEELLKQLNEKQLEELREIDTRLQEALQDRRAGRHSSAPLRRESYGVLGAEKQVGSLTFRYETVNCGKKNCSRCPHGPYWYAYWKEGGRTHSRYIGRTLPAPARQSYEEKRRARLTRE